MCINKDILTPSEKQSEHDHKWGMYISVIVSLVQPVCPNCGNKLAVSPDINADLFCIACNGEYIVVGETQLERVDDGFGKT